MREVTLLDDSHTGARGTSRLTVLAPQRGGDERAAMTVP